MARGFGERLAGAGQALQAFDAAYMQARERQERQRQLRDAQRLREEQAAQAALRLKYGPGAAPTAPSMAGLPVAGLAPVARTQAPAQRQAAPATTAAPVTTAAPPAAAPATRLVGTMEPQQEIRPMELQYRQGLITQRPPYVNYTETQEQQLAGMRQRRATINQELRYIDEQLRQIPTSGVLGSGDQVLRQTYEAQKARLMREREALVNQLRGVTEDTSTRVAVAPGRSVPVPSTSVLAVPFQTQPGQMTTPELVLREEPAAGVRPDMMRLDGTTKSARGFLGPITNNISGKTMTELSVGQPGSPEGYYPLLVPTLTQDEIRTLQNLNIGTDPIPPSILRKAKAHADQRTAQGLSPFYQDGETTAAPATTAPPKQQKAQEELVQAVQSVPMGEGPAPQKLADTVAAAAGGIMYGADPEDFDPQAMDFAVQQSLQMRQRLVESYNIAAQYGFPGKADEIYAQIQAIDLGLYKAQGEMGVYEGVGSGNWSRAVTVLSQFKGKIGRAHV